MYGLCDVALRCGHRELLDKLLQLVRAQNGGAIPVVFLITLFGFKHILDLELDIGSLVFEF